MQAEVEILDRKLAALKQEMNEQAADIAQRHKFNSGATEPTGQSSPRRLASGLAATAEASPSGHLPGKLLCGLEQMCWPCILAGCPSPSKPSDLRLCCIC